MKLTLSHLLTLPAFHSAAFLAGAHLHHREVTGLVVLESPATLLDVRPGDLSLTSGFLFRDDLLALVRQLARRQAAALVIRVGTYVGAVPATVRAEAESLGFPLIALPPNLRLRDAVSVVAAELLGPRAARETFRMAVLEDFLQRILLGDDTGKLVQRLAQLTGNHVTFEAPGEHVASMPIPDGFEPGDFPRLAARLIRTVEVAAGPRHIPGSHNTPPRMVMPVRAGTHMLGILSLWETARDSDWRDELALRQVATTLALSLMQQHAARELQARQRREAIHRLLEGATEEPAGTQRQAVDRLPPSEQHVVLVIPVGPLTFSWCRTGEVPPSERLDGLLRSLEAVLQTPHSTALGGAQEDEIVLVVSFSPSMSWAEVQERCRQVPRALRAFLTPDSPMRIGVGAAHNSVRDVALSLNEAREAIRIGARTTLPGPVIFLEDLALFRLLSQTALLPGARETVAAVLGPLLTYDAEHGSNLLQTLQVFVEYGGNSRQTAETLFIHPNTLQYRLNRVRELIGLDWRDPHDFFMIQMAMHIWRLAAEID